VTGYVTLDEAEKEERPRPASTRTNGATRFTPQPWSQIAFDGKEEWTVKRILPRVGLAAIFGKPGSFKSFIVAHIGLSVALGWDWAGRRVHRAPVIYVAAEAAAGLRKRKAGFQIAHPSLGDDVPFLMVPTAPNLGAEKGDLAALVTAIEAAGVSPGVIVLDTLAATLAGNDENGSGMTAFVANAGALAEKFKCLVLVVHHTGLGDDRRMRGHSSLLGALDAAILCERVESDLAATLTLSKIKDDSSDVRLVARLERVVIGHDEDGDEISTLVVNSVEDAEAAVNRPRAKLIPPSQRLLMACVVDAIEQDGESFKPFSDGPVVRGVADGAVRKLYFTRIAERADSDEDQDKLFDRQRKGFKRSIEAAIKSRAVIAIERKGERFLWLP
jgi:hypothetical protein